MEGIIVFRLLMAFLVGVVIGLDRERSGKPAGIRTQMLVCVGSALLACVSVFLGPTLKTSNDPARLMAQIVTGIGFLGAGVIIKNGGKIQGVTTAATIWVTAAIGISIGSGFYISSVTALFLVLLLNPIAKIQYRYGLKGDFYTIKMPLRYQEVLQNIFSRYLIDVRHTSVIDGNIKVLIHSSEQANRDIMSALKRKRINFDLTISEE